MTPGTHPCQRWADSAAAGVEISTECIEKTIRTVRESGLPHEFRTTAVRPIHTSEDLLATGRLALGADRFVLQRFVNGNLFDPSFSEVAVAFGESELESVRDALRSLGVNCDIR